MKVALFEPNLFWDAKARAILTGAGWECVAATEERLRDAGALVVGLYAAEEDLRRVVAEAKLRGVPVIGHAGHKEKPLLNLGHELGCDRVLTNGELAHRLKAHLEALFSASTRDPGQTDG